MAIDLKKLKVLKKFKPVVLATDAEGNSIQEFQVVVQKYKNYAPKVVLLHKNRWNADKDFFEKRFPGLDYEDLQKLVENQKFHKMLKKALSFLDEKS